MTSHVESLPDGFTYRETEEGVHEQWHPFLQRAWVNNRRPATLSELVSPGGEVVAYLTRFHYLSRFGEVALEVEGIGGFATPPRFRRRGHASRLLRTVIERSRARVPVMLLHGIDTFYTGFGFVPVAPERRIEMSTRTGLALARPTGVTREELTRIDREKVCSLYNEEHARRPLTAVRAAPRLRDPLPADDWFGCERGLALERDGRLRAFAILHEGGYGREPSFTAQEAVAANPAAALELIAHLAEEADRAGVSTLTLLEPQDSTIGRAALRLGARVTIHHRRSGGWMGRVLDRGAFVGAIGEELTRRAGRDVPAARAALASGDFYADDGLLLALVLGHRSYVDARDLGELPPDAFRDVARQWFPGGGNEMLPLPYIHQLDRY